MPKWDLHAVIGGMRVGDSFFIPCLQCEDTRKEIRRLAASFSVEVEIRPRTEDLIKGLRTWRIR